MYKVPQHRADDGAPNFPVILLMFNLSFFLFFLSFAHSFSLPRLAQILLFQSFYSFYLFCFPLIHCVMLPVSQLLTIFIHHHLSEAVSLLFFFLVSSTCHMSIRTLQSAFACTHTHSICLPLFIQSRLAEHSA